MSLDSEPEPVTEPDERDEAEQPGEQVKKQIDPQLLRSDRPCDYLGYPDFDNDDDELNFSTNATAEMEVDAKTASMTSQTSSGNGSVHVQGSSRLKMPAKKNGTSSVKTSSNNGSSSHSSRRSKSKSRHSSRSLKVPTSGDAAGPVAVYIF